MPWSLPSPAPRPNDLTEQVWNVLLPSHISLFSPSTPASSQPTCTSWGTASRAPAHHSAPSGRQAPAAPSASGRWCVHTPPLPRPPAVSAPSRGCSSSPAGDMRSNLSIQHKASSTLCTNFQKTNCTPRRQPSPHHRVDCNTLYCPSWDVPMGSSGPLLWEKQPETVMKPRLLQC